MVTVRAGMAKQAKKHRNAAADFLRAGKQTILICRPEVIGLKKVEKNPPAAGGC